MKTPPAKDAVAWLKTLVACPSVNPLGEAVVAPPYGEGRLAAMLAAELRRWGAAVELRDVFPGRPNLIAVFAGRRRDRRLLLECHGDTVTADGMTVAPFSPLVRRGRLHGRGACDAKGALAAMLAAVAEVLRKDGAPPVTVCLAVTCDEEYGAGGARALVNSGFRADAAIVGEPTDLRIVDAHKGAARFEVTVKGRAAHSSDPRRGINAVSRMARVVSRIDGRLAAELARRNHPRLGQALISVGVIRGGRMANVVPDSCVIEIDRRLLPDETVSSAEAQLRRHLDAVFAETPRPPYRIRRTQYYAPLEADRRTPFARQVAAAVRATVGRAAYAAAPWTSDAGIYHAAGMPVFVFGPGSIRQAHSGAEFVDTDQVRTAARTYAGIIRGFAGSAA